MSAKKAKKSDYIVRSDDGKLYRVSHSALHANPLKEDDPAQKQGKNLHALARKSKASHPMVCIIAAVEVTESRSSAKRD